MQHKPYEAPYLAFFSKSLARSVASEWGGIAFGYLFAMIFSLTAIFAISLHLSVSNVFDNELPKVMKEIPDFEIKNGEFICSAEMPYTVKDPKTGDLIVYIDTRDNAQIPAEAKVKVSKTEMVVERNQVESRTFKFESIPNFTKSDLDGWLGIVKAAIVPVAFVVLLIGGFIFAAVQVLIYALIGLIMAKVTKVQIDYSALVRLSVISITPVLILDMIIKISPIDIPFWPLLAGIISMVYLYLNVSANKDTNTDTATSA